MGDKGVMVARKVARRRRGCRSISEQLTGRGKDKGREVERRYAWSRVDESCMALALRRGPRTT